MEFPIYIDEISMGLSIVYFKESQVDFSKSCCISALKVVLIIASGVNPDEMQHHAAFHLGPHCLPKYPFRGSTIQSVKSRFFSIY